MILELISFSESGVPVSRVVGSERYQAMVVAGTPVALQTMVSELVWLTMNWKLAAGMMIEGVTAEQQGRSAYIKHTEQ